MGNYTWREDAARMVVSIAAIEPSWISEIHGVWREKHLLNLSRRKSAWLSRVAKSAMQSIETLGFMHNAASRVLDSGRMVSSDETYAKEAKKLQLMLVRQVKMTLLPMFKKKVLACMRVRQMHLLQAETIPNEWLAHRSCGC